MDDNSNIVRYREEEAYDIVLRDSEVQDLGIELSSIRQFDYKESNDLVPIFENGSKNDKNIG